VIARDRKKPVNKEKNPESTLNDCRNRQGGEGINVSQLGLCGKCSRGENPYRQEKEKNGQGTGLCSAGYRIAVLERKEKWGLSLRPWGCAVYWKRRGEKKRVAKRGLNIKRKKEKYRNWKKGKDFQYARDDTTAKGKSERR